METNNTNTVYQVFKTCSCCGVKYFSLKEFLAKTTFVGVLKTKSYMQEDLELRTCTSCNSTLSLKVPAKQVA